MRNDLQYGGKYVLCIYSPICRNENEKGKYIYCYYRCCWIYCQLRRLHRSCCLLLSSNRISRFVPDWRINLCIIRSEEHTSELQSRGHLVCRLLLEKKK